MTIEIIIAIAHLCAMPNGSKDHNLTDRAQLACQQELIKCADKPMPTRALVKCVLERKPVFD